MKKCLLLTFLLLSGCGMSKEEFESRAGYCHSIGTKVSVTSLSNGQVERVWCIDEEGNRFRSKTMGASDED